MIAQRRLLFLMSNYLLNKTNRLSRRDYVEKITKMKSVLYAASISMMIKTKLLT